MDYNKKGKKGMCQKLKEIHKMTPEQVLNIYAYSLTPHFSMDKLLQKMGITYKQMDFSILESQLQISTEDAILGLAVCSENDLSIFYSEQLNYCMINYVLAHELAHCCLHLPVSSEFHVEMKTEKDIYSPSGNKKNSFIEKKKEQAADQFAADLLIPTKLLADYLLSENPPTKSELLNTFHVPECLLKTKIESINRRLFI